MDCIFCKIINKEIPAYIIYEDNKVLAFLDAYPNTNGHTLIIPKKHYQDINDIPITTLNHINQVAQKIYPLLKEKLNFDGLTFSQNNEYGQQIKHYHLHLIPLYKNEQTKLELEIIFNKINKLF